MATRWARVVRGLVASTVAVFVAAFAHVVGGGAVPGAAAVALAFAFCALASIGLAGRRVSTARLSATVILSQGLFHVLFLMSGGTATSADTSSAAMPGMQMGAATMVTTSGPGMVEDGWMWLAHGVAAIVTIVALVWGERAFWKLFEIVLRAFGVAVAALRQAQGPELPTTFVRVVTAEFLRGSLRRRGPPRLVAST